MLAFVGTAEEQHLMPVLGSNIPQSVTTLAVNFTLSGNYSDSNPAHHVVEAGSALLAGLEGHTIPEVQVFERNGGKVLNANLEINYYTMAARYDRLERQHTWGAEGSKTKGLLERGGYWDRMQARWGAGVWNNSFNKWWFRHSLQVGLEQAKAEQLGTWDQHGQITM